MTNDFLLKYKDVQPKQYGDYVERCYPVSVVLKLMGEYQAVLQQTHVMGWKGFDEQMPEYMQCCIIVNQWGSVHEAQYTGDTNLFTIGDVEYRAEAWMPLPSFP